MRRLLSIPALVTLCLVATTLVVVGVNLNTPRLLILQSHSRDCAWTQGVDTGIHRVLDDQFQYVVRWFYMDTDLHPWPEYQETIGRTAQRLIVQWQPDVVLAVDDDAQQYVMRHYVGDDHLRIVFAGVHGDTDAYGYTQAANVTGIVQQRALSALRDAVVSLAQRRVNRTAALTELEATPRGRSKTAAATPTRQERVLPCSWNPPPGGNAFPRWQAMTREVVRATCDKDALVGIFAWSPIRLVPARRESLFESWQSTAQETTSRVVPTEEAPNPVRGGMEVRVLPMGDDSTATRGDEALMRTFDWRPLRLIPARSVATFPEWQAAVESAAGRADFILVTDYRQLSRSATDHTRVPPVEVISWTLAHSSVPVIGTDGCFVKDGGYFAVGASPFEQGEVAAQMSVAIIEHGTIPRTIPVASTQAFVVFMRGSAMSARGLSLPQIYESFARATNNYFD